MNKIIIHYDFSLSDYRLKCPECKHVFTEDIDLGLLDVKELFNDWDDWDDRDPKKLEFIYEYLSDCGIDTVEPKNLYDLEKIRLMNMAVEKYSLDELHELLKI